ncbi:MAG: hypothetical protein U0836_20655 [Pirellulales bacterium]
MARDYTTAELHVLRGIVRWRDVVRHELDTIDSWRNCDPNEWLFHGRTQEPPDLLRLTSSLVGWIGGRMPNLDPKPFLRVRKIINEWYSPCRSRDTIPPQVALVELVERCQILTLAIEERIEQDRLAGNDCAAEGNIPAPPSPPHGDGPEPQGQGFWWKGTRYQLELSPQEWKLFVGIWALETVAVKEVGRLLGRGRFAKYDEIKPYINKLSGKLASNVGFNWAKTRGQDVIERRLPPEK